ncbi:disease resistance protein RPV1-like [Eucalyptus grandis]|uniref:disease resistance protein RPV1-like n=1 Tax=Eucalyptus grandis TaxID=71139 RepID=UPI00192EE071|nr:disease resistance protein RPV1-like [Eucalyptus grandis]
MCSVTCVIELSSSNQFGDFDTGRLHSVISQNGPFISNLKNWSSSNLRKCSRVRQLPQKLCCMKSLRELLIDGTGIYSICFPEGSLGNLEILSACDCQYLQDISTIGRLRSLSSLAMNVADIDGLPYTVGFLQKLQRLSLRNCWKFSKLLTSIGKLELLEFTRLVWGYKEMIASDLSYLTNLKELLLKDAEQPEFEWPMRLLNLKIPNIEWIARLPSLETLQLSPPMVTNLPRNLGALTQLQELSLSYMKELDLTRLPSTSSLSTLRLKHCMIQEPYLSGLKYLSELELDNYGLAKIGGLENLKLLEVLEISKCSITNLDGIKDLPRLRKVQVFSCDLASLLELRECKCGVDIRS